MNRPRWIVAICIAIVMIGGIAWRISSRVKVQVVERSVMVPGSANPIVEAIDCGLSDAAFEEIVRSNRAWLSIPSQHKRDVLTATALLMKTNYARILIQNGADVAAASNSLTEIGGRESLELIGPHILVHLR